MSRSLALTEIPNEVQEENVLEILSRHGVLQSWTKGNGYSALLRDAFQVLVDLGNNGINSIFEFEKGQRPILSSSLSKEHWAPRCRCYHLGPFPPGPKGLSFIGNVLDVPSKKEWLTFARWGKKYGDIASVSFLGRCIVVINSAQTAIDILDKKGAIDSDRPIVAMGGELVGWNAYVLMRCGSRFRDSRRRAHQIFGTNAALKIFLPIVELEAHQFLKMRHIPDWFPGAEFKRTAKKSWSTLGEVVEQRYSYVKQRMAAGDARYSFTSCQFENGMSNDKDFDIKWSATTLYIAMLLHPDIQAKAQEQIDAIVGNDRLPRFDDREHLPYINALALEVNRWPCRRTVRNMLHDLAVYDKPFEWRPWNKEWGNSVRHAPATARSASRTDSTVLRYLTEVGASVVNTKC
ncbi:cytochrome P450 [Armillaria borealis]|uniref:Cytochrome P450 n=1 Tax=Armillaria borealis TaxID=47425 RepID=A0AA39J5M3_9AGAR|nr:cytochrome P450 [Armillaria borealis]